MKRVQRSNNQNFGEEEEPKKVFIQVKMTARCLFGAPDPALNEQLVRKVHSTKKWAFERKWNFSIDTTDLQEKKSPPSSNNILQSQSNNQEICYEWEGPFHYHDNYLGKCDDESDDGNRYGVLSSNSLAPLLAAGPIFQHDQDLSATAEATGKVDESTGVNEEISSDLTLVGKCEKSPVLMRTAHNSPSSGSITSTTRSNTFTGRIPSNSSQAKSRRISPTTPPCESPEIVSPDDLVFTFPSTLKQRCITDYMKVKKVPRVK